MCTRYYIENENPIMLPMLRAARQSRLCEMFAAVMSGTGKTSARTQSGLAHEGSLSRDGNLVHEGGLAHEGSLAGEIRPGREILTGGEIRPTMIAPVMAPSPQGTPAVYPMKWGYQMNGRTTLFNARSETAAEKPTFREDWRRHRCVVPASYYYEWEHFKDPAGRTRTGDKYAIRANGQKLTWLCGLYRIENGLPCFVILTREPAPALLKIHDRMPLILPEDLLAAWIHPDTDPDMLLRHAWLDMHLQPDRPSM